jgi:TusA-related sulfurtransferase
MDCELLDLRSVACPINFVRTKIKLDSLSCGAEIKVLLDDGEPIESVSSSITQEGHEIKSKSQEPDGYWVLEIKKRTTL